MTGIKDGVEAEGKWCGCRKATRGFFVVLENFCDLLLSMLIYCLWCSIIILQVLSLGKIGKESIGLLYYFLHLQINLQLTWKKVEFFLMSFFFITTLFLLLKIIWKNNVLGPDDRDNDCFFLVYFKKLIYPIWSRSIVILFYNLCH